jgi:hypothetical protein
MRCASRGEVWGVGAEAEVAEDAADAVATANILDRDTPRSVFLLVAFLALVATGVVTVLLPELASDEDDDYRARPAAAPATDG